MINVLLITFLITLFYIAIANRMLTFVRVLAVQGVLLFFVVLLRLTEINAINLILILLETIIFKSIAVPFFLGYVIRKNKITREAEPYLPNFVSLIIITVIIVFTILLTNAINDITLDKIFFIVALSSLFTGLYFIVTRRKIITHIMGYLVIENGVFVLSLAAGTEMTQLVNVGIMLDIFVSVLVLGVFVNRIGDTFDGMSVDDLTNLKD